MGVFLESIYMLIFLQSVVFALGLIAMIQAGNHAWFFSKSKTSLSWTMVAFMMEQVISSGGTLLFATNSLVGTITGEHSDIWNNIDPSIAISIRSVMFIAMIHSTSAMTYEIRKIQKNARSR